MDKVYFLNLICKFNGFCEGHMVAWLVEKRQINLLTVGLNITFTLVVVSQSIIVVADAWVEFVNPKKVQFSPLEVVT
jgi:hypothetical protein